MPELPEVETTRRLLEPHLVGRTVTGAWGFASPKFDTAIEAIGGRFEDLRRRGKYLLAGLDTGRELIVHLGMTGHLAVVLTPTGDPYLRAWWDLDDGMRFEFRDVRRFGRARVVAAGDYRELPTLAAQGPEPWDPALDDGGFARNLAKSNVHVKTQLLSQRPIAGVGNIYADEALWLARINPGARSLSRPRAAALLDALRAVLASGIDNRGTTLRDYRTPGGDAGDNQHHLHCYGRAGEPCDRCGAELRSRVLGARTTTWCPVCQRR